MPSFLSNVGYFFMVLKVKFYGMGLYIECSRTN